MRARSASSARRSAVLRILRQAGLERIVFGQHLLQERRHEAALRREIVEDTSLRQPRFAGDRLEGGVRNALARGNRTRRGKDPQTCIPARAFLFLHQDCTIRSV